jgi:hypothetical protein
LSVPLSTSPLREKKERESIVRIYSHSPPLNPSSRPKERERKK